MGNEVPLAPLSASAEQRRQRAVESLGLQVRVDRVTDERLDRVTRLARKMFDVEWTSVTVIDRDQAWFPSSQGFEIDAMERDDTFCERTTRLGEVTVVPDALADKHYRDLPAVREAGIRFYAGVPLRDSGGNTIGVFCLYDDRVRTLDDDDLVTLVDLATWAQQELVAATEMSQARHVQASMLPAGPLRAGPWEVDGICIPALSVGGDLFDYGLTNGVLHVGLGDVMGKGTGAALVGSGVRARIRGTHGFVTSGGDLGRSTTQVARGLRADLRRTSSFVTLFQAAVDLTTGETRYVDAGMGLCLVLRTDGTTERLCGEGRPLGVLEDDTWQEQSTVLEPGDRMLVFSDGLLDLIDDSIEWWRPVGALMRQHPDAHGFLGKVTRLVADKVGLDDVTAVIVDRRADDGR
jgi:phosphoserine phosphatase RsbU/P